MKTSLAFCLTVLPFLYFSCAKQSTPSGGPKDSIPPILVKSIPGHKQLNFKSKKIELEFSEMVILNNPREQIIITPTVGDNYEPKIKKKTVTLEFEKEFKDSTTYTINFRESIQDITEKNPAKNLQLAFSTGSYIDSLSIEGSVYDLLKGLEIKDATVALFQNIDTFNIFKHKPSYLTKTNEKGNFKIENLKPGKYYIYAFEDKNKNAIADSKSEFYGYNTTPLLVRQNITNVFINIIKLDARSLKLTSARPYNNYFNIKTSKALISYRLLADSLQITASFGDDKSNVKLFNTNKTIDSLKIRLIAFDSIKNKIDTTLYAKFNTKNFETEKFSIAISEVNVKANKGLFKGQIKFNKPIKNINFDSLIFTVDSLNTVRFTNADLKWDTLNNALTIERSLDKIIFQTDQAKISQNNKTNQPLKTNDAQKKTTKKVLQNTLTLGKGAFISIDQDSSSATSQTVSILKEAETGIIIAKVNYSASDYILELLDKNYTVIQTIKNKKDFRFDNLSPNSYLLRIIVDKNGNGKWDPGNYFNKEEPEPITFYKTEKGSQIINLKANWEVGPLLITP